MDGILIDFFSIIPFRQEDITVKLFELYSINEMRRKDFFISSGKEDDDGRKDDDEDVHLTFSNPYPASVSQPSLVMMSFGWCMELYEKFKRMFSLITLPFPQAHFYINHTDTGLTLNIFLWCMSHNFFKFRFVHFFLLGLAYGLI